MTDIYSTSTSNLGASIARTGYSLTTITLNTGTLEELKDILEKKIAISPEVYNNSSIVIDIANVNFLHELDFKAMQALCREYGVFLIGLSGVINEDRAKTLYDMNIPIVNSTKFARMREENFKPRIITKTVEVKVPVQIKVPYEVRVAEPLMVINRNLRSGDLISAPNNSVLVIGNVASTARIIASHNIIILGDLHGDVLAGAPKGQDTKGYPSGMIYVSGLFEPSLVAISAQYQTADDLECNHKLQGIYGSRGGIKVTLTNDMLNYTKLKVF